MKKRYLNLSKWGITAVLLVVLLLAAFPAATPVTAQVTILSEDFEDYPAGWTITDNLVMGCEWDSNASKGRPNYAGGDGECADADAAHCSPMDTELWTPVLDLSGLTGATLEYVASYNDLATEYPLGDYAEVLISTNGGSTWTRMVLWDEDHDPTGPGEAVSIDLTPYVGSANTIISFHYRSAETGYWFEIDQVRVEAGEPLPVGGTAMPVNKLALLAPWLVLAAVVAVISVVAIRRRGTA